MTAVVRWRTVDDSFCSEDYCYYFRWPPRTAPGRGACRCPDRFPPGIRRGRKKKKLRKKLPGRFGVVGGGVREGGAGDDAVCNVRQLLGRNSDDGAGPTARSGDLLLDGGGLVRRVLLPFVSRAITNPAGPNIAKFGRDHRRCCCTFKTGGGLIIGRKTLNRKSRRARLAVLRYGVKRDLSSRRMILYR